jgi:ADP-ribosyl-[dinitrogen reductase] hydrolase
MQMRYLQDKVIGSMIGLAVGDAFGAPYEFKIPPYIVSSDYIEGGVHNVRIGEWTDDTSMTLCLAESLLEKQGFDAKDQIEKYILWKEFGYFSTRGYCFDIGNTVEKALNNYQKTNDPYSGLRGDENSGNGSLMRLAPIALYYSKNVNELIKYAKLSSLTTHQSELAVDACIFYAQLIKGAINGVDKEMLLSKDFVDKDELRPEIVKIIEGSYKKNKLYKPTGYVIDTLEVALMAFNRFNTFEEGLLHTISLGYDTDTVGAVYGQLAGAFYGYDQIPLKWKNALINHDEIYKIASRFINIY